MAAKKSVPRRRARGTNPLFWSESRKVFIGRVAVGRNTKGKLVYTERSHPKQTELVKLLKELEPLGADARVTEWCARWLQEMQVRPRTAEIRAGVVRDHIAPTLGHLKLRDLTAYQINQTVATWSAAGLHVNTVRLHLAVLHTCLRAAQAAGLRPDNPAAAVKKPKGERTKIVPFTPEEVVRVVEEATARRSSRMLALVAVTGCRAGEALALDVANFDPATGELTIRQSQDRAKGLGPTKSASGVRTIRVPAPALPAVRAAIGARTSGPLFATDEGARNGYHNVRGIHQRTLARLGIAYRGLHHFRHTVATQMLAAGVPVGDVAKFLGDTPEMIVKTYLHATGADCTAVLERIFAAPPRPAIPAAVE